MSSDDIDVSVGTAKAAPGLPAIDAQAPFNKPSADLVLRSSDNVSFRVRKAILAEASPVFEDMFTLTTPQNPSPNDPTPIIDMAEDRHVLDGLLRLCYPIHETPIRTVDKAILLLEAATKYAMDGALAYLSERLVAFAEAQPMRVYALAIRFHLCDEVVQAAAKAFLNVSYIHNELKYLKDMDHISASTYLRLLDYRDRCSAAAVRSVNDYSWIRANKWCWIQCTDNRCKHSTQRVLIDGAGFLPRLRWTNLIIFCRAMVQQNPCARNLSAFHSGMASALLQAGRCESICQSRAPHEVIDFMELLIARVDEAVSKVSIHDIYRDMRRLAIEDATHSWLTVF